MNITDQVWRYDVIQNAAQIRNEAAMMCRRIEAMPETASLSRQDVVRLMMFFHDAAQHIIDAPLLLVWIADLARASDIAAGRGIELEGVDFTETFLIATIDAALAAQNALVAAESLGLGLGTVYIGALRNHPAEVARELGLPERSYAVFGLVVGHPDPAVATAVKPRLPQEAVLHREQYSTNAQREAIERHDRHALAFREEQGLSPQSWSDLVIDRLRTVASLKGRHVLRDVLRGLGFAQK